MKYFMNTELARLYHVSEKSVRNWIQSTRDGKLSLELHHFNNRYYVANTSRNISLIEELVQKGRKYKNTRGFISISPKKDFYDYYSQKQILDIISNLDIHREIPVQYSYFDGGADAWDKYVTRLSQENTPNILNSTHLLLEKGMDNIDLLINKNEKINIVDIGPGNAMSIKPILETLLEQDRLGRYIAIDISKDMLAIVQENIKKWFGEKVSPECHVRDITHERINDLLNIDPESANVANLVFLLGGTLSNFRAPNLALETINNSLGLDDIFISSGYLDTPKTRRFFDFYSTGGKLPQKSRLILSFLNLDESHYEAEQIFNDENRERTVSAVLSRDVSIEFKLPQGKKHIELKKNERILLWRYWHRSLIDFMNFFDRNDYELVMSNMSPDMNYYLIVAKVKSTRNKV